MWQPVGALRGTCVWACIHMCVCERAYVISELRIISRFFLTHLSCIPYKLVNLPRCFPCGTIFPCFYAQVTLHILDRTIT